MYELIVLMLLTRQPMHGYLIAKIINDIIGPYARISNGRLYPMLAKLEAEGFVKLEQECGPTGTGERHQRCYAVTTNGRGRLHQLMMDTNSNPGDYGRIFWLKVPFLHVVAPHERLHLVDHYITYCQSHIYHLTGEADTLQRDVAQLAFMSQEELDATILMMRHRVREWQLSLDDAQALRERIVARAADSTSDNAPMPNDPVAPVSAT